MNRRSPLLRYGVVPLAVAAAMLLRWPLWSVLHGEFAFLFLWPVVIVCAWYGGLGPGLLATLLSATAAAFFLLEPRLLPGGRRARRSGRAGRLRLRERRRQLPLREAAPGEAAGRAAGRGGRPQREWLRVSLASIGDAVIATDTEGRVSASSTRPPRP